MITEKQKKIIKNELKRSRLKAEIKESVLKTIREEPNYMDSAGEKAQAAASERRLPELADALESELDLLIGSVTPEEEETLQAAVDILQRLVSEA